MHFHFSDSFTCTTGDNLCGLVFASKDSVALLKLVLKGGKLIEERILSF